MKIQIYNHLYKKGPQAPFSLALGQAIRLAKGLIWCTIVKESQCKEG